jgi:hypothetical protein
MRVVSIEGSRVPEAPICSGRGAYDCGVCDVQACMWRCCAAPVGASGAARGVRIKRAPGGLCGASRAVRRDRNRGGRRAHTFKVHGGGVLPQAHRVVHRRNALKHKVGGKQQRRGS